MFNIQINNSLQENVSVTEEIRNSLNLVLNQEQEALFEKWVSDKMGLGENHKFSSGVVDGNSKNPEQRKAVYAKLDKAREAYSKLKNNR